MAIPPRVHARDGEQSRRLRRVFDKTAVSLWYEDLTEVRRLLEEVTARGVTDLRGHLRAHPTLLHDAAHRVRVVDVNPASVRLFGAASREELLGSIARTFSPGSFEVFADLLVAMADGAEAFDAETPMQTLHGDPLDVMLSVVLPDAGDASEMAVVSLLDVTARRRLDRERDAAAATMQRQFAELEGVYRHAPVGLALLDRDLQFVRVNERLAAMSGHPPEQHLGRRLHEVLPPLLADRLEPLVLQALDSGAPAEDLEWTGQTTAGAPRTWHMHCYPLCAAGGDVVAVSTVVQDVSVLTATQRALEDALRRDEAAQDSGRAALYEYDPATGVVTRSAPLASVIGYATDQMPPTAEAWTALMHPDDRAHAADAIQRGIASGVGYTAEYRVRHKDGQDVWLLDRARVVTGVDGGVRVFGLIVDVTDRGRQARHAAFLAALEGTLASVEGVACAAPRCRTCASTCRSHTVCSSSSMATHASPP